MIKEIASKDNFMIKRIKQLEHKKYRDKYNLFLLEGPHLIEEALKNDVMLNYIVYSDSFIKDPYQEELISFLCEKYNTIYNVSDSLFEYIADTESPQGIIAAAVKPNDDFEEILKDSSSSVVVLDRIQDPGNMGTIIRTADAAGIQGIISIKGSVDFFNSKTVRAAAGSFFRIPLFQINVENQLIDLLTKYEKNIIATSPKAEKYYYDLPIFENYALIIGNEANGVSEALLDCADYRVKIPMLRDTESLNASVAASIIIYEMVRKKMDT